MIDTSIGGPSLIVTRICNNVNG